MKWATCFTRFLSASIPGAAGLLVAMCAVCAEAEIISALLDLSEEPGKNELLLTVDAPGWSDDQGTTVRGDVEVALTIDFDPLSHQPTAVTAIEATGGSLSIDDLLFTGTVVESGEPDIEYTVPVTGVQGRIWSVGPSTVTGGNFPADDHGIRLNGGTYDTWLEVEGEAPVLLSSRDFAIEPFEAGFFPGTGTVAVSLASIDGTTGTYDVAVSLPMDFTNWIDLFVTLSGSGAGEVTGSFTRVIPEPASLVLLLSLIPIGLFALWSRSR